MEQIRQINYERLKQSVKPKLVGLKKIRNQDMFKSEHDNAITTIIQLFYDQANPIIKNYENERIEHDQIINGLSDKLDGQIKKIEEQKQTIKRLTERLDTKIELNRELALNNVNYENTLKEKSTKLDEQMNELNNLKQYSTGLEESYEILEKSNNRAKFSLE